MNANIYLYEDLAIFTYFLLRWFIVYKCFAHENEFSKIRNKHNMQHWPITMSCTISIQLQNNIMYRIIENLVLH